LKWSDKKIKKTTILRNASIISHLFALCYLHKQQFQPSISRLEIGEFSKLKPFVYKRNVIFSLLFQSYKTSLISRNHRHTTEWILYIYVFKLTYLNRLCLNCLKMRCNYLLVNNSFLKFLSPKQVSISSTF